MFKSISISVSFCIILFGSASPFVAFSQDVTQLKAENAVKAYLIAHPASEESVYTPYSFGEVEILVPKEILFLEELKELRRTAAGMTDHYRNIDSVINVYDTLIAKQNRLIAANHIRNNYRINLVFCSTSSKTFVVHEAVFYLSANFVVKDLEMLMRLPLNEDDFYWFRYFFEGKELFDDYYGTGNGQRTLAIYDFFNDRLENIKGDKSAMLKTIIIAVRITRQQNSFDPDLIVKEIIKSRLNDNRLAFPGYKPLAFSMLSSISEKNGTESKLLGYNIFHLFSTKTSTGKDSVQCLYYELDPWFVVAGELDVEPPFEKYFESK